MQATQKNQKFVRPTWSPRQQMTGRKMANIQLFFSFQGRGGSPTGPGPENWVGDQDSGNPGRTVSSGLQVPCEPGHFGARTRPPW